MMSPPGKQEMGKDGKNGFDACAKGTVQEKCEKGRGLAGFELSLPEGSTIGNAQRETTLVPAGSLYVVESDFDHQPGFDNSTKSMIFARVFQEKFRVFGNFGVSEAGIGFSDVSQALPVADCKGHVGEYM